MTKSTSNRNNGTKQQVTSGQSLDNAAAEEQRQTQHRTAIRIAGIEGIEGFADLALGDDDRRHPEKM